MAKRGGKRKSSVKRKKSTYRRKRKASAKQLRALAKARAAKKSKTKRSSYSRKASRKAYRRPAKRSAHAVMAAKSVSLTPKQMATAHALVTAKGYSPEYAARVAKKLHGIKLARMARLAREQAAAAVHSAYTRSPKYVIDEEVRAEIERLAEGKKRKSA